MPKPEILELDDNHVYRLRPSGTIVPGVSEVINSVFPFNGGGLVVQRASDFGTAVHKAIELNIKGQLNWGTVDDSILPYIKQADMALSELDVITTRSQIECMLYSKKYMFAGRIDLVENYVIDWKSGHKSPVHRVKTAAYRHLWNANNTKDKKKVSLTIYLNGEDERPEIVYEKPSDFNTFLSCLEIYNFKKKENLK